MILLYYLESVWNSLSVLLCKQAEGYLPLDSGIMLENLNNE